MKQSKKILKLVSAFTLLFLFMSCDDGNRNHGDPVKIPAITNFSIKKVEKDRSGYVVPCLDCTYDWNKGEDAVWNQIGGLVVEGYEYDGEWNYSNTPKFHSRIVSIHEGKSISEKIEITPPEEYLDGSYTAKNWYFVVKVTKAWGSDYIESDYSNSVKISIPAWDNIPYME